MTVAVAASPDAKPPVQEPFSQPLGEPLAPPPAERQYRIPETAPTLTNTLPPGRTVDEQRDLNDQILDVCPSGDAECMNEMGYVSLTRPPTEDEARTEGNVIALVAVVLGALWLAAKVWAWLFASRTAYRYITKPRE